MASAFPARPNLPGLRLVRFGEWDGKKNKDDWCFDLRAFEASNPLGQLRSAGSRIVIPAFVPKAKPVFERHSENDWPAVYASGYSNFVAQHLPKGYGRQRQKE